MTNQALMAEDSTSYWRNWFGAMIAVLALSILLTQMWVDPSEPTLSAVPFFSSVFLICCLLGGWLGLGHGIARFLPTLTLPTLLALLSNHAISGPQDDPIFYVMAYSVVAFVAFTTFILRLTKGTLIRIGPGDVPSDALKFGIKDVMIFTTVVALLVAIGKAIVGSDLAHLGMRQYGFVGLMSLGLGIATVMNLWAIHGRTVTPAKILVVIAFTTLAAMINWLSFDDKPWFFPLTVVVCESLACALMFCLRQDGYRFVKE